jgi:flagellar biogenesis protein FliO
MRLLKTYTLRAAALGLVLAATASAATEGGSDSGPSTGSGRTEASGSGRTEASGSGRTETAAAADAGTAVSELTPEARRERIRQIVDDPELRGDSADDAGRGFGWAAFQMFVVLGIVILLIYLTLNVGLRRVMGLRSPVGRRSTVQVLERIPLDQKRMMFVVKAGAEYLLVGGVEGGLSLICKLDPAEVERVERENKAAPAVAMPPFLQKLLTRKGGTPPQAG